MAGTCRNCNRSVRVGAKFCAYCRAPLSATPRAWQPQATPEKVACPHCTTLNRASARFCARCGQLLTPVPVGAPEFTVPTLVWAALVSTIVLLCVCAAFMLFFPRLLPWWYVAANPTPTVTKTPTRPLAITLAPITPTQPPTPIQPGVPSARTEIPRPTATATATALPPTAPPTATLVAPSVGTRVGQTAPDFSLLDSAGRAQSLWSLRGKPVIINFWASWCRYCLAEMPDFDALYKESQDQELVVLGIDTMESDRQAARTLARNLALEFPILWDEGNRVGRQYGVSGLPTSFFVDRAGVIRVVQVGPMNKNVMKQKAAAIF